MSDHYSSQIIGNEEIKKKLKGVVLRKTIGHALLFAGPDGIGKSLFALDLAASIIAEYDQKDDSRKIQAGQHPDVHVYRPEGKLGLHSIQSLRQFSQEVYFPPYEASWKFFIIHDADRMLSYSANALLKTFEEPPPRTVIILLSRSQATLLPTILSRCCTFHFKSLPENLMEDYLKRHFNLENSLCLKIVRQAQGSLGRAIRLIKQGNEMRPYLLHFLAKGPLGNYHALQESVNLLSEQVESAKKKREELAKQELFKIHTDQLSIQQQHALEKELEGLVALTQAEEAQDLFDTVLSWYRDAHLLLLGGDSSLLINPDFQMSLEQAVQRGEIKPLHQVYQAIQEAYLALQRSTSLSLCLENLFLKLDYVI